MPPHVDRTGEKNISLQGYEMEIIKCYSVINLTILFSDGTIVTNKRYNHFLSGKIKNPNHKSVLGIGFLGEGEYNSKDRSYDHWKAMLHRCYNNEGKEKLKTYQDVIVCEEWHNFQNFARWYNENIWNENFTVLDKDILIRDNKTYSPDTCILVDKDINSLLLRRQNDRGSFPIGVTKDSRSEFSGYTATLTCEGVEKRLGTFRTMEEAFEKYKTEKEKHIKKIATKYKNEYENFPEKLFNVLINYSVNIND